MPPLRIYASFLIGRIQKHPGGELPLGQPILEELFLANSGGKEQETLHGHSDPRGCRQGISVQEATSHPKRPRNEFDDELRLTVRASLGMGERVLRLSQK